MKYTILELTQNILSSMNSDEVNSISDTTESRQVAEIIRTAYFNIIARANLPEQNVLFSLSASNNVLKPVLMFRPDNVRRIDWIKYDVSETVGEVDYQYVTILPLEQFLSMVTGRDSTESNVDTMSLLSYTFYYTKDARPKYCTIINDYYVVFDSYNEDFDTTLQESKTLCIGLVMPTFSLEDSFTPDLDEIQFPLLLNEAKSLAFLEMKQVQHSKAEQESRRQWNNLQKTKELSKETDFNRLPDFGRKGRYARSYNPFSRW